MRKLAIILPLALAARALHGDSGFGTVQSIPNALNLPAAATERRLAFDSMPGGDFMSRGAGYGLRISSGGIDMELLDAPAESPAKRMRRGGAGKDLSFSHLKLKFLGGKADCQVEGLEKLPGVSHYYGGPDPSRWLTNLEQYSRVRFKEVYPGIDVSYYGNGGKLEFDLETAPGADLNRVRWKLDGGNAGNLDGQGALRVELPGGRMVLGKPRCYLKKGQGRGREIEGRFRKGADGEFGVEAPGYDGHDGLIIDPVLSYTSYYGGTADDYAYGVATDGSGCAYAVGFIGGGPWPSMSGANVFVAKFNSAGTALLYSTILGGSAADVGYGIAVDAAGDAYITGYSRGGFPTTAGCYRSSFGATTSEPFVAKLSPSGTLVYATYLGGQDSNEGHGIVVDAAGSAYVHGIAGYISPSPGGYQSPGRSGWESFVAKLSPSGASLSYLATIGASNANVISGGISVDPSGNAYLCGVAGGDFPTTAGAYLTYSASPSSAFVTKLNPGGSALLYSTYVGGSATSYGMGVVTDAGGNATLCGFTYGNFPVTAGAYQTSYGGGAYDAFVCKLNAAGSGLTFSTYLGGSGDDAAEGLACDNAGVYHLMGETTGSFPMVAATQAGYGGGPSDVFVSRLSVSGNSLVFSTCIGGGGGDYGGGVAVDGAGNAYVCGRTGSTLPGTSGSYQPLRAGGFDAFVAKFSGFPFPTLTPSQSFTISPTFSESPTVTETPTATPSSTASPSATPSFSPSATFSDSPTFTLSGTPSHSPTVTETASPSATRTMSPTATPSASPSPTASPTASPSQTPTASGTATPTATGTASRTSSPTSTPSASPSSSPTASPSFSASPTASPSATVSVTLTQSPSLTASPSETATPVVSATGTPSSSPSATGSPSQSPSPTGSPSASPTGSPTRTASPSPAPSPGPSATASPGPSLPPFRGGTVFSYPNPAIPGSQVTFRFPPASRAVLVIYDWSGRKVLELPEASIHAPQGYALWNGKDSEGQDLASGAYFAALRLPDGSITGKFSVLGR